MTEKWCVRKLVMPSVVKINEGELRFHLFGFLMCIAATAARALKSVLQGILHSSEGSDMAALSPKWSCQSSMFQKLEYFKDCC
ncbi:hypothetical protein YC2023_107302 [Brassica napus]